MLLALICALVPCLHGPAHASQVAASAHAAPAILGNWTSKGAEDITLQFQPGRCCMLRGGQPVFFRAEFTTVDESMVVLLERWARWAQLEVRLDDGELRVRVLPLGETPAFTEWLQPGEELVFTSAADVPPELSMQAYPWPTGVEVDADTIASLRQDLADRVTEDQRVRRLVEQGASFQEVEPLMTRVDADNTEFVLAIAAEFGWLDAGRFGAGVADDAFLIVQHSPDLRLMCTALPLVERDVLAGRQGGQAFALLHDRSQLNLGYAQRYGSQLGTLPDGRLVLMPCEDPARVDEFREQLGMRPLAEYLAYWEAGVMPLVDLVAAEGVDALANGELESDAAPLVKPSVEAQPESAPAQSSSPR